MQELDEAGGYPLSRSRGGHGGVIAGGNTDRTGFKLLLVFTRVREKMWSDSGRLGEEFWFKQISPSCGRVSRCSWHKYMARNDDEGQLATAPWHMRAMPPLT